ncbi:hypothetical protein DM860_016720 [Cuscuta australis]|uniref:Aminoglycoside phosphotransferase domain-containing protein n=1 Tax=Cuscuta australis TaxID=267555 RepID=A0A328DKR6_9ASTE|nr:hypothetical protein DM860_016720 [Cuscuta australis]
MAYRTSDLVGQVNPVHQFDREALRHYLSEHVTGFPHSPTQFFVSQFGHGHSNPTFLMEAHSGAKVMKYVLRKKPPGELLQSAHAVEREYEVLNALGTHTQVPVPKVFCLCTDSSVIGTPFYIMEYLEGRIFIDPKLPDLTPKLRKKVYHATAQALASIHSVDVDAIGISSYGKRNGYCKRQVERWAKQYLLSTGVGKSERNQKMLELADWLREHIPLEDSSGETAGLVHGDFRIDNLVFHPIEDKVIGILDWELSTLGNQMCDVAYSCLNYIVNTSMLIMEENDGFELGSFPEGIPSLAEYLADYCSTARKQWPVAQWKFYMAFSLFRGASVYAGVHNRWLMGIASGGEHAKLAGEMANSLIKIAWSYIRREDVLPPQPPLGICFKTFVFLILLKFPCLDIFNRASTPSRLLPSSNVVGLETFEPKDAKSNLLEEGGNNMNQEGAPVEKHIILATGDLAHLNQRGPKHCGYQRRIRKPICYSVELTDSRMNLREERGYDVLETFEPKDAKINVDHKIHTIVDLCRFGDSYIINGKKWWTSGAMDPRCKLLIVMGKTDPTAPLHKQQSMILVDINTPGITIKRPLAVFGFDDAPHGHAEILFENVRVSDKNILLGEGRGFEIAQGRLGPGRLHHCMRLIGAAERGMQMMVQRATERITFGKFIMEHGSFRSDVARCRIELEKTRLLVLEAADKLDRLGNKEARCTIAMAKVAAPEMALKVLDMAIQVHGAAGLSGDTVLAHLWASARTLRIADGPDEVHLGTIAKLELRRPKL